MKIFYCDILDFPLPRERSFLADKYRLLQRRVVNEGLAEPGGLVAASPASRKDICRVHDPVYVDRLLSGEFSPREIRAVGLPWSARIVERALRTVGATVETCRAALQEGVALHLGGGTHHAFADRARGFCWLNDCAVAAAAMVAEKRASRVLILDCDVHQGDGTAAILRDDPSVSTFSIHGEYSYPFHKQPADLDIALPVGAGDLDYLEALQKGLDDTLSSVTPDLVIYLAGADVYRDDRFGCLALSREGIARRDWMVLERFRGAGIPVALTLAGGYARNIEEAVEIHFETARLARRFRQNPLRLQ